jgi:predicted nucleic acid-binding protein
VIIVDTNVLSALMRPVPDTAVVLWLDSQPRTSIWTTSITVLEVRFGLQTMLAGKRRAALARAFEGLLDKISQQVLPFDLGAAEQAAVLMGTRHQTGHPVELRDTMIAGIVLAHHATLATRNTVHFEDAGVPIVNPWTA